MTMLESILDVFSNVGEWISESITALMPVFYGESGLTFIGVLAVASLAFSVVFLGRMRNTKIPSSRVALSIISANSSQNLGFLYSSSSDLFRTSSISGVKKFARYPLLAKDRGVPPPVPRLGVASY